ncbi:MAG: hypothetical protein WBA46_05085 [Thermomicrobiales bacterium]
MMDDGSLRDSVALVAGVPLVAIVPALVELAKRLGLPARWAGLAAIVMATVLLACGDIALGEMGGDAARWLVRVATWLLGGLVYGLAAAGLYSQRVLVMPRRDAPGRDQQA